MQPEERRPDELTVGRDGVLGAEARVGEKAPPVHRDGGQDAGRAVRGRRDDTTAGRVLFVDGERERAQPFAGQLAPAARLGLFELLADEPGPPLDLEHAGEHAAGVQPADGVQHVAGAQARDIGLTRRVGDTHRLRTDSALLQ